jgi:glutathione S-transferase
VTSIVLHAVPPSHPCMTVEAALRLKSLEYERIDFAPGEHPAEMEKLYGAGHTTVPGVMLDGEAVHGSRAILERLEALAPSPALFPDGIADEVREAERWGDEQLQSLGRRLPWGALHFRPEAMGTFADAGELDPAGTDWAMRYVRATWKYHQISCKVLAEDLAGLPEKLAHVDALAAAGVIGGELPTAADLQIGATLRVLLTLGDLRPLLEAGAAAGLALRWFPEYPGAVPAGAFPASWVPRGSASPSAART